MTNNATAQPAPAMKAFRWVGVSDSSGSSRDRAAAAIDAASASELSGTARWLRARGAPLPAGPPDPANVRPDQARAEEGWGEEFAEEARAGDGGADGTEDVRAGCGGADAAGALRAGESGDEDPSANDVSKFLGPLTDGSVEVWARPGEFCGRGALETAGGRVEVPTDFARGAGGGGGGGSGAASVGSSPPSTMC